MMLECDMVDMNPKTLEEWHRVLRDKAEAIGTHMSEAEAEFDARMSPLRDEQRRVVGLMAHVQGLLDLLDHRRAGSAGPHGNCPKDLPDIAYRVLKEAGGEIHYRDLAARIIELGYKIRGADPATYLLAYIGRDDRFVKVRRGTYALAEWRPRRTRPTKRRSRKKTTTKATAAA